MQAINFIKELEKLHSPIITIGDIAKIIRKGRAYTRVYANRLAKKNLLYKLEKGKYSISKDPFEIASNVVFPSYISFISAYSIYGLTTQTPVDIQVVALKSKKPLSLSYTRIVFVKFKKQNLFGYKREKFRNKYIFIAEPEKAIVDSLYLPKYCPIAESYTALKSDNFYIRKFVDYVLRMNSTITIKRLGYLLELCGHDVYRELKHLLNKRYDNLNPYLPHSRRKSKKWRLNINEVFQDD